MSQQRFISYFTSSLVLLYQNFKKIMWGGVEDYLHANRKIADLFLHESSSAGVWWAFWRNMAAVASSRWILHTGAPPPPLPLLCKVLWVPRKALYKCNKLLLLLLIIFIRFHRAGVALNVHCPAKLSSIPNQTHLNKLIKSSELPES